MQVDNAQAQVNEADAGTLQAEAEVNAARAGLPEAVSRLAAARANLAKAERDWGRAQALYPVQAMTRPDYDAARMSFETAAANVEAAQAGVDGSAARVANAEALLRQRAAKVQSARQQLRAQQIPLADTELRAPTDVVVLSRKVEVGTFVQPGTVAFVVATTNPVKAVFSVPDSVVRTLSLGQMLPFTSSDAGPDARWQAPITAISAAADPQTRVYQVELTLPNPQGALRLGMIVTVPIGEGAPVENIPAVPLAAVVTAGAGQAGYAVFVVEQQQGASVARRRSVVLGEVIGNRIAVREGLRIGERVVVSGGTIVTDGQPVKVVP